MINEKNVAFRHKEMYVLDSIQFKLLQWNLDLTNLYLTKSSI